MPKKTEITEGLARQIADAAGFPLYERKSSMSAKANAQLNLSGRTHYVDEGTLRHFASRINSSRETDFGLVFALVESVSGDYQHSTRGFRHRPRRCIAALSRPKRICGSFSTRSMSRRITKLSFQSMQSG